MSTSILDAPKTTSVDQDTPADFTLDLRVVRSSVPIAQLRCDTSDGCGSTCATSACNSVSNNP